MVAVVRNYCHYSEDELWNLTLDQLSLDYYMAKKSQHENAKMIANQIGF